MFYGLSNMNKIGKMKDESEGKMNIEFVGLKSKMYSFFDVNGKEIKTGNWVNSVVVENVMRHKMMVLMNGNYDVCKICLSCFVDKRYILDDGINSLAYFHKDTRSQ